MVFASIFGPLVNLVALKVGVDAVTKVTKSTADQARRSKGINIAGPQRRKAPRPRTSSVGLNIGKPININVQGFLKDFRAKKKGGLLG